MAEDRMRYDLMVEGALRAVVREAMTQIAAEGLPGEHHLYVTFRTSEPDVRIPEYLTEQYPDEMTIVLQHQYEDLDVTEDGFAVSLNFSNVQERLRIPFSAITAFADPSANFGLQFKFDEAEETAPGQLTLPELEAVAEGQNDAPSLDAPETGRPSDGNVVTLDTFRKK
jgi:hypothetical protein